MSEAAAPAPKPIPYPDRDSVPFWDGLREGELRVQRCGSCSALRWPPRALCPRCRGFEHAWVALSGLGRVVAWVRTHQVFAAAWKDDVPYDVVTVALDEQDDLRLVGRLEGGRAEGDLRVRARFVRVDAEHTLLHWEPER